MEVFIFTREVKIINEGLRLTGKKDEQELDIRSPFLSIFQNSHVITYPGTLLFLALPSNYSDYFSPLLRWLHVYVVDYFYRIASFFPMHRQIMMPPGYKVCVNPAIRLFFFCRL